MCVNLDMTPLRMDSVDVRTALDTFAKSKKSIFHNIFKRRDGSKIRLGKVLNTTGQGDVCPRHPVDSSGALSMRPLC